MLDERSKCVCKWFTSSCPEDYIQINAACNTNKLQSISFLNITSIFIPRLPIRVRLAVGLYKVVCVQLDDHVQWPILVQIHKKLLYLNKRVAAVSMLPNIQTKTIVQIEHVEYISVYNMNQK